jgi:CspA family cold shock protein
MGQKGRDRSQRRGFDDDHSSNSDWKDERPQQSSRYARRESEVPTGPAIDGVVKWFNAEKGFGFVELTDGSGDVFLHAAVLESAGHNIVEPGTKLSVQVAVGQKGRQVTSVLAVDTSAAAALRTHVRPPPRASSGRERPDPATATSIEGAVKWFNPEKGFGFVACEDGGRDVFLHATIVEQAGLRALDEGQRVAMKVVKTQKGREAISVSLLK